jgi:predicted hydrocarbon binding protein
MIAVLFILVPSHGRIDPEGNDISIFLHRFCARNAKEPASVCAIQMYDRGNRFKAAGSRPFAGDENMKDREFTRSWVCALAANIRQELDEKAKMSLMESCGRACARSASTESAKACGGDMAKLLSQMGKWVGKSNVRREGDSVHVVYDKCYCRLDDDLSEQLGHMHCYCSRGWLKEMFETVAGTPVNVDLLQSIRRGDAECRFIVRLRH